MSSDVLIREIDGFDELRAVEELQKEVWGFDDRDIVPLTQLVAVRETGGALIGAFDGPTLAGFVYGFVGLEGGRITHHSHMVAVSPRYRNVSVGYRLKLAQREAALRQGIQRMTWTFDPLQSLNAFLNFRKLGTLCDTYKMNFYGEPSSSFLHRTGTDRLWLTWLLRSERVHQRLMLHDDKAIEAEGPLLLEMRDGLPGPLDLREGLAGQQALIEIPSDINDFQQKDRQRAVAWREATRRAFTEALSAGFVVEDFSRRTCGGRSAGVYLLSRGRKIEDFV